MGRRSRWLLFIIGCVLLNLRGFAAEPLQVRTDGARFVGSTGCKSSSCHGGAGEKHGQYFTWSQKDYHTRGFAILTNARSQRMAEALGLPSAETSSRCTICHSPFAAVASNRLTSAVDPREGVSCESCHGAAEPWLRGHTRKDWSYAMRVGAGMRDLRSFYVRANTCVACHQNLDHDLLDAGHPELVFELNSQSIAEPKHWQDPPESDAQAWLVGQAVALRELSWRLRSGPDPRVAAQWNALVWLLGQVSDLASGDYLRVQEQADNLARHPGTQSIPRATAQELLRKLAGTSDTFVAPGDMSRDVLFYRAQRLVLALDRLSFATKDKVDLTELRNEVGQPENFDAARFGRELTDFRAKL